jgi:hypothetical protein
VVVGFPSRSCGLGSASRYKERKEHMKYYYYWKPSLSENRPVQPNMQSCSREPTYNCTAQEFPPSSFLRFLIVSCSVGRSTVAKTSVGNDVRTGHLNGRGREKILAEFPFFFPLRASNLFSLFNSLSRAAPYLPESAFFLGVQRKHTYSTSRPRWSVALVVRQLVQRQPLQQKQQRQ